jgi:ribosomal protein S18 acetylase RimI-like enzyme
MIIRAFGRNDIEPCAAMIAATPLWQRYGMTEASAVARLSTAMHEDATILIAAEAADEAVPLGFVWLAMRGAFDARGYIRLIGVMPGQRSKGIGHKLLTAAEDRVRPTTRDMFLLCSDFNVEAQRFYERNGYTQVGALQDYVLMGVAELIYRKRL